MILVFSGLNLCAARVVGVLGAALSVYGGMAFGSPWSWRLSVLLLLLAGGTAAWADAVLVLDEPIKLAGRVTSAGHVTVWFTRLCSDDHVHMRLCEGDEAGSVVGRIPGLNGHLDWLAISPGAYFFAVDRENEIPASVSREDLVRIDKEFEADHRASFAVDPGDRAWSYLLGESYRRRVVLLRVKTTEEQDERVMSWLNGRPNRNRLDFFIYGNCADFVQQALNVVFPGAIHRSIWFDAGMMTPKQLGTGLHRYAMRHPELDFHAYVLPQVSGSMARSGHLRGVIEHYLKGYWFLLPLDYLLPYELGTLTVLGLADRRYVAKPEERVDVGIFFGGAP